MLETASDHGKKKEESQHSTSVFLEQDKRIEFEDTGMLRRGKEVGELEENVLERDP